MTYTHAFASSSNDTLFTDTDVIGAYFHIIFDRCIVFAAQGVIWELCREDCGALHWCSAARHGCSRLTRMPDESAQFTFRGPALRPKNALDESQIVTALAILLSLTDQRASQG